jgi:outer membrane protein OmpA-like peptidoglycan-associated protein
MVRKMILLLLAGSFILTSAHASQDTFSVFFRTNQSSLTEGMQRRLDDAIYRGAISYQDAIALIGYADEVGGVNENLRLSRARAMRVKAYLIQSGFRAERITLIEGKGKAGAHEIFNGEGYPRDRRVDIVKAELPVTQPVTVEPPKPAIAAPVDVSKVAIGESIKLNNIYFVGGSHEFLSSSFPALEELFQSLMDHPKVLIKIEGHICCFPDTVGDGLDFVTNTPELSLNRARAVRDYLVKKGIAGERMKVEGFGRRRPIFQVEHTEEEMQANRRVEIRIVK